MTKRLWRVDAEIAVEMYVLAETLEDAQKIGFAHWHDEWRTTGDGDSANMFAYEVRDAKRIPPDSLDSLPWGEDDQERTVRQILEAARLR